MMWENKRGIQNNYTMKTEYMFETGITVKWQAHCDHPMEKHTTLEH